MFNCYIVTINGRPHAIHHTEAGAWAAVARLHAACNTGNDTINVDGAYIPNLPF